MQSSLRRPWKTESKFESMQKVQPFSANDALTSSERDESSTHESGNCHEAVANQIGV